MTLKTLKEIPMAHSVNCQFTRSGNGENKPE